MADQPPSQPSPTQDPKSLRKECPACQFLHPHPVAQCEQCGVIFEKWRDPKKLEAERKLQALAEEANRGISWQVKAAFAAVVLIPVLLYAVPDIGSRILGGKLRYNVSPDDTFQQSGRFQMTFSSILSSFGESVFEQVRMRGESRLNVNETDSGGNTAFHRDFQSLEIEAGPNFDDLESLDSGRLAGWKKGWRMNAHGGRISNMADSAMAVANTSRHLANRMRQSHFGEGPAARRVLPKRLSGGGRNRSPAAAHSQTA